MEKYNNFESESIDIAENLYKLGKYEDSAAICTEIIQLNPNDARAWNLLGINMLKIQSYKKAIECFTKASQLSPSSIHYIINLAKANSLSDKNTQAIKILSNFLNQSINTSALFDLAHYLSQNNEENKAIDIYRALYVVKPSNIQVLFALANEYIKNNDIRNSLEFLEKAYNLGHQEAGIKLINQYVKLNKPQTAIEFAKNYYFTKTADFYFIYGNALSLCNNKNEADTCYRTAIEMNSKPRYIFGYASFLLKYKEYKEGFKYYETRREIKGFSANIAKLFSKPSDVKDKVVLVFYEQNLSETIIFSRFLNKLMQIAKKVFFYPQKELADIFSIDCISSINVDYDISVPLPSLPYILNITKSEDLDLKAPLIFNKTQNQKNKMIKNVAIAFGDFGKMKHDRMKLERILDITRDMNINLIHIRIGGIEDVYSDNENIIDKGKNIKSYIEVLDILKNVDLFVGNDTEYLHLAANIGIPCILFKDTQRWIWEDGKTTNWYKNIMMLEPDSELRWDNAIKIAFRQIKKYASKN